MELTREEYNTTAKKRGVIEPQNMFTKKLLNTLNKYDSRHKGNKLSEIGLEKLPKYRIFQKMN